MRFEEIAQGTLQRGIGIRRVQKDHIIHFVDYGKRSIDTATVDCRLRCQTCLLQIVPDHIARSRIAFNKIHPASTTTEGFNSQRTAASIEVNGLPVLANHGLQDGEYCPTNQLSCGTSIALWRPEPCSLHTASNNSHAQSNIIAKFASQSKHSGISAAYWPQIWGDALP